MKGLRCWEQKWRVQLRAACTLSPLIAALPLPAYRRRAPCMRRRRREFRGGVCWRMKTHNVQCARPTDNPQNRARKRITHPHQGLQATNPLPLCHICSESFCLLGGAHSALCSHRVEAGERVGAQGLKTPRYSCCVLIGLTATTVQLCSVGKL